MVHSEENPSGPLKTRLHSDGKNMTASGCYLLFSLKIEGKSHLRVSLKKMTNELLERFISLN